MIGQSVFRLKWFIADTTAILWHICILMNVSDMNSQIAFLLELLPTVVTSMICNNNCFLLQQLPTNGKVLFLIHLCYNKRVHAEFFVIFALVISQTPWTFEKFVTNGTRIGVWLVRRAMMILDMHLQITLVFKIFWAIGTFYSSIGHRPLPCKSK